MSFLNLVLIAAAVAANQAFVTANSLAGHGQYEKAVAKYKEALQKEPDNAKIHHMYARTLALMGLLPSAVDEYRVCLRLTAHPDYELENDVGVALAETDEIPEAAIHLKKSITLNPKFTAAYNNLGVALVRLGDYRAAKEIFEQSLKMQPNNKAIEQKLAQATAKLGISKHFDYIIKDKEVTVVHKAPSAVAPKTNPQIEGVSTSLETNEAPTTTVTTKTSETTSDTTSSPTTKRSTITIIESTNQSTEAQSVDKSDDEESESR